VLENQNLSSRPDTLKAVTFGILVWSIGFLWLFRAWVFHSGDGIWGDEGDARLLIGWLEHWYRWFSGAEADWRSPIFFFPERNTLGLSDAYFLYAIPYSVLRAIRCDPFTAFMVVMAMLSAIGFASFMRLAINQFHVSVPIASVGAFLFVFANMMAVKATHAQSYSAMLLPVVVDLVATALVSEHRRAIVLGGLAGLLHALIFFTAFLTGWFFSLIVLFAGMFYLILPGRTRREFLQMILKQRNVAAGYAVGFLIGIIPFVWLYVPIVLSGYRHNPVAVRFYMPWMTDIINVGKGNLVWGHVLQTAQIADQPQRPLIEVELGYSPGVFILWISFTAILFFQHFRGPRTPDRDRLLLAVGLALIVGWLIQLNWFGLRPWRAIYHLVPGATAVRTTFRAQIVDNLMACILVAVCMDRLRNWIRTNRILAMWLPVLPLLLMIEQINTASPHVFSRAQQLELLAKIPAPPPDCKVFYLIPTLEPPASPSLTYPTTIYPSYVLQSDAVMVAVHFGIPTVNGNTSIWPAGWHLMNPDGPFYHRELKIWARAKHLDKGFCGLDSRRGIWVDAPP